MSYIETLKNNRLIRNVYYRFCGIVKKKELYRRADKVLSEFGIVFTQFEEKEKVIYDMIEMYKNYGFGFDEYLYYQFQNKDIKQRLAFVADWEHLGYACTLNHHKNDVLFDNKWMTYKKYRSYYKRTMICCNGEISREAFYKFIGDNNSFIVKPLDSSCGRGIQIIHLNLMNENTNNLFEQLLSDYNGIFCVESLIKQVAEMEKFHPSSVNTIRVATIRMDDEVRIIHPFMRIGQHGNFVDNAGAGGIICAVDVSTGKIMSAADEHGHTFEVHPDSGEKIIGFVIPKWDEAKKFVEELAQVTLDNRYTGWDIALTKDGWVLVEANRRGQFVWQIAMQKGFRKEINQILKDLGKRY